MYEVFFCPQHGIIPNLFRLLVGSDPGILFLTVQLYCGRVRSFIRRA
jgi:hypothetical protein